MNTQCKQETFLFQTQNRRELLAHFNGGIAEASKSYFGEPICETIIAGDINGDCKIDFADFVIMSIHWLQDYRR